MNIKIIFQSILITVAFGSCNADLKTETLSNSLSPTTVDDSVAQSAHFAQTTEEAGPTYQKDASLIGKTTVELDKVGWFNCAGTLIESEQIENKYAVSQLAKSQEDCRNGEGKMVLERFVSRNGNKTVFEVIDEINIHVSYPENVYNWTTCRANKANGEQYYVIHFKDLRQAELTEIYDLWVIDLKAGKFTKVQNSEGFTCVNPDYADGL